MDFFTVSTFRETLSNLTKKPRDGYMSVVKDICSNLQNMNDDILRYLTHAYRSKGGFTPIESQTYDNVMEMIKYWETEKSHDDV